MTQNAEAEIEMSASQIIKAPTNYWGIGFQIQSPQDYSREIDVHCGERDQNN